MKTLSTAVDNALAASNVPLLVLVHLAFTSGDLYLCNAPYTFAWDGHTFLGAGGIGTIDEITESAELSMTGIKMSLSGVDPANIAIAIGEPYQGRPCTIWLAPLNSNYQILADPVVVFKGRMDTMQIDITEDMASISVTAESRLTDWNKAAIRRFNHEDQIAFYPTDKFFEYIPDMVQKQILWGVPSPAVPPIRTMPPPTPNEVIYDASDGGG